MFFSFFFVAKNDNFALYLYGKYMVEKDRIKLKSITISGFKSFDSEEHTIELGDITALIGANNWKLEYLNNIN